MTDKELNQIKETTQNGTYIDINTHFRDIKKLQSEITHLKAISNNQCDDCACEIANERDRLKEENTRLKAERDKAVGDLQGITKYNGTLTCHCNDMLSIANKWRGLNEVMKEGAE